METLTEFEAPTCCNLGEPTSDCACCGVLHAMLDEKEGQMVFDSSGSFWGTRIIGFVTGWGGVQLAET